MYDVSMCAYRRCGSTLPQHATEFYLSECRAVCKCLHFILLNLQTFNNNCILMHLD